MSVPVKQAYREVLKLIKRLPPPSRPYYTQYARENFVTYSEAQDPGTVRSLLARTHRHTCWILKKLMAERYMEMDVKNSKRTPNHEEDYGVDEATGNRLKEICFFDCTPTDS